MARINPASYARFVGAMWICVMISICFGITACSRGGGGPAVLKPEDSYKVGFFVDSPVEGLQYRSITWNGVTGSDGSFYYGDGDEITFYIGGVVLGRTAAQGIITPVDLDNLVLPNFSTKVINISRFLLSLDEDRNPNNGIKIPKEVTDALKGIQVDFSNPNLDNDAGVKKMFEILNGQGIYPEELNQLVSSESAQIHLENTVNQIQAEAEEAEEALLNLKPHASIDLPFTSIILYEGQSLYLKGSVYGGRAPFTYSWNINNENPFSKQLSPGNYVFKNQGSYNLAFTAADSTGYKTSDIHHITVDSVMNQSGQHLTDSIPSVSIISPASGTTIPSGSALEFQAILSSGNAPLYYGWLIGAAPGNTYNPTDENVVNVSPGIYMVTQRITLAAPGTYAVTIVVRDTNQEGKTCDDHAASVMITVD